MKPARVREWWRYALAGVFLAAAISAFFYSRKENEFYRRQIQNRARELDTLNGLAAQQREQKSAQEIIAASFRADSQVADVFKRALPGVKTDLAIREQTTLGEGWVARRYDVRFEQLAPEALSRLLAAIENAWPAIRLTDLQVTAPAEPAKTLQVQLILAELSRE